MIVGNPQVLAIESDVSDLAGAAGLGYFVVHILGIRYGVHAPDATMLGNSVDAVAARLARRGLHQFGQERVMSAAEIAERYLRGYYRPEPSTGDVQFAAELHDAHLIWAPDGDEAFDDGSHILQFDRDDAVRVIALRNEVDLQEAVASVRELMMPSAAFYDILQDWHRRFVDDLRQRRRPN